MLPLRMLIIKLHCWENKGWIYEQQERMDKYIFCSSLHEPITHYIHTIQCADLPTRNTVCIAFLGMTLWCNNILWITEIGWSSTSFPFVWLLLQYMVISSLLLCQLLIFMLTHNYTFKSFCVTQTVSFHTYHLLTMPSVILVLTTAPVFNCELPACPS